MEASIFAAKGDSLDLEWSAKRKQTTTLPPVVLSVTVEILVANTLGGETVS